MFARVIAVQTLNASVPGAGGALLVDSLPQKPFSAISAHLVRKQCGDDPAALGAAVAGDDALELLVEPGQRRLGLTPAGVVEPELEVEDGLGAGRRPVVVLDGAAPRRLTHEVDEPEPDED